MGKKKKILLEFKRIGKVRTKWKTKFAKLLEANLATIRETVETVAEKVEEVLIKQEAPKEEVVEKPKTTRKRKATTTRKPKSTTTKKTTTTTRKRRTTKTKPEA